MRSTRSVAVPRIPQGTRLRRHVEHRGWLLIAICLSLTSQVPADNIVTNLPFQATGASMWGPGQGFQFQAEDFIGVSWDESIGIGPTAGFELSGNTEGRIGLEYEFTVSSGTVNVDYPVDATINFPNMVNRNEQINISSSANVLGGAMMNTLSPQATARLELPFELSASASGSVDPPFVSPIPFTLFPSLGVDATHTFFDISTTNPSFSVDFGPFGSITASVPTINTSGTPNGGTISTSGSDDVIEFAVDIDGIVSTLIPQVPPLSGSLDLGDEIASISYDLLDLQANLDVGIAQSFDFTPGLKVKYTLETGQMFTTNVGDALSFAVPDGVGNELDVTATYFLDNTFVNDTDLVLEPGITLSVLSGSAEVFGFELLDFGPVFSDGVSAPIPLDVFSNSFAIDFPTFETNFTIIVPEPSSVVLLAFGIATLVLCGCPRKIGRA